MDSYVTEMFVNRTILDPSGDDLVLQRVYWLSKYYTVVLKAANAWTVNYINSNWFQLPRKLMSNALPYSLCSYDNL